MQDNLSKIVTKEFVSFDPKEMSGTLLRLPTREELSGQINGSASCWVLQ